MTRQSKIQRALRLVWQSGPVWTIASVVLLLIQGALPLLTLYLMKLVVDAVTHGMATSDKTAAFERVLFFIGLAAAIALVATLCRLLAGLVAEVQMQRVTDHVHDLIHAKAVGVDLEYYENAQYYDTLHHAQQEAAFRPPRILTGLVQAGQSGVSLLAMAGLLFSFHWGVALILFAAVAPGALVRVRYAGRLHRWQRQRTPAERRGWYFHWLLTGIEHAKEIRLFDLGALLRGRFRQVRAQLRRERMAFATKRTFAELAAQTGATLAVFGSYGFIAYQAIQGAITVGDLVMYYQAFQRGQEFLREMLGACAGLYEDSLFLSGLYEFLDLKRRVLEPPTPVPAPHPLRRGIVFDRVSFRYPTGGKEVLQDVSLTIRPGENVALVGENGSGKTTLVKLLCRLYDPTGGKITLDGVELERFDTSALRREISVIFQDYAHYHLTARENIWFGNSHLPPERERIVAAARSSGADEVIQRLKHGYDTTLGKWFEDGEELSIGEWQKVALARAFLRDAQIIVLDEPTSALDAEAECEVFEKLRKLAEGRTVVLISHRFSTVRMADRIYVLDGGRIIESGAHDDLVHRGGRYARLFESQAQYYR